MTERALLELAQQIVSRHMPKEVLPFQVGAPPIIADLFAGRASSATGPSNRAEFGFGYGEVKAALEFVVLLKGTFEAMNYFRTLARRQLVDRNQVVATWTSKLTEAGLDSARSAAITAEFAEALVAEATKGR